jgi:hypothetical protein
MMACLYSQWDRWKDRNGKVIESCTILTTDANALLKNIHDRMPVILQTFMIFGSLLSLRKALLTGPKRECQILRPSHRHQCPFLAFFVDKKARKAGFS